MVQTLWWFGPPSKSPAACLNKDIDIYMYIYDVYNGGSNIWNWNWDITPREKPHHTLARTHCCGHQNTTFPAGTHSQAAVPRSLCQQTVRHS
jgi:hypothetical protein